MPRPIGSRDTNEDLLVDALAAHGLIVYKVEVLTPGIPDLQVICKGKIYPVELKYKKNRLNPNQLRYALDVYYVVLRYLEHVAYLTKEIKKHAHEESSEWYGVPGYYGSIRSVADGTLGALYIENQEVDIGVIIRKEEHKRSRRRSTRSRA